MMFDVIRYMANLPSDNTRKGVLAEHYEDRKWTIGELLKSPMTLSQGAAIMNEYRRSTGDSKELKEADNGPIYNSYQEECHADHGGGVQRHDEPVVQ